MNIPTEIVEQVGAANGKRDSKPTRAEGQDKAHDEKKKRLDKHLEGVTRNLFQVLSEAKLRQDYALVLEVTDRLIQVAELEARRMVGVVGEYKATSTRENAGQP